MIMNSESDIIVLGLISSSGDNESRKTIEMRLIHSLGTVNPHGINERFASISYASLSYFSPIVISILLSRFVFTLSVL